ncbi:MAG TPA: radical SAM protein [Bacilli bacterium]|nr:radical SAM protein [Bacilli bacterium]
MDNKIKVKILNIIVTKDCNLTCAHCMRGKCTREYIDIKTLDNLLSQIEEIDFLNITGGEPFLAPKQISYIVNYIKNNNIKIDAFSIITNGTVYNKNLLDDITTLSNLTVNEKYDNAIAISKDIYHDAEINRLGITEIRNRNQILLEKFCKLNNINYSDHDIADNIIIDEGRGKDIRYYHKKYVDYKFKASNLNYRDKKYNDEIIVDTNGFIFISSDVSYDTIEDNAICNINDSNLLDILSNKYVECINNFQKVLYKN